jgi:hypothetical protein
MPHADLLCSVLLTLLVSNPVQAAPTSGATPAVAIDESEPLLDGSIGVLEDEENEAAVARQAAARSAEAERGVGWQVAALLGYGLHSTDLRSSLHAGPSVSASSVGAGLRAGYAFASHFYLGATFIHHFGQSRDVAGGRVEAGITYGGVEAGLEIFALGPVIGRPYIGVGPASVTFKKPVEGTPLDASGPGLAIWPGLTVLLTFGEKGSLFAGVDGRFTGVFHSGELVGYDGWSLAATGGVTF